MLTEVLVLLKTNERGTADLTLINMNKDTGTLRINKTLKPGMKFISESPTGYYRKVILRFQMAFRNIIIQDRCKLEYSLNYLICKKGWKKNEYY